MKKIALLLAAALLLGIGTAYAADLGVSLVSGPELGAAQNGNLDDMKVNVPVEIPGYATITITDAAYMDTLP